MTRTMLIATVAALAITAPAAAQDRGERGKRGDRGDQVQKSKASRSGDRAKAPQRRAQASERRARAPRVERRVERKERAPRVERRAERQERAPRVERRVQRQERAQRVERRAERQERTQRVERRERAQRVEQRAENRARTIQRREVKQDRRADRIADTRQQRRVIENRTIRPERRAAERREMWANLAQRRTERVEDRRSERRVERRTENRSDRRAERRVARIGQRIDQARYANNVPFVYRARYEDTPRYYYRYNDDSGYLYRVNRDNNLVSALIPLLGGAYSVGRPLPLSYSSYNVPYGYRSLYYDTPDYHYRYGSGAIYRVDSGTNLIQAIVALLAGQSFGVGQMLPASYSTYNVPYGYRDRYYDTDDSWYRYNNGNIYQVDPRTRLIEASYPMSYGGFQIGSPMPYGYADYNVPYGYRDLYYDTPDYNYRYANGGIYQVDPTTQMIQALVALVTGQNYNVGQAMPATYSVYNVPYDYRDRYADTSDSWYRYNDGMIYELEPGSRMIRDTHIIYT